MNFTDEERYMIDDDGKILALDQSLFAAPAWEDAATFDEALRAAGVVAVGLASMGSRKEAWVSDLMMKRLLDIEEGAALITAIICRRGRLPFKWRGATFFPLRPDFGHRVITTRFEEKPLNHIEREMFLRLFEHRDAIMSLHLAVTNNQPNPESVNDFEWWRDFWASRPLKNPSLASFCRPARG